MIDALERFLRWLFTPRSDWRDTDEYNPDLAISGSVVMPEKRKRKNDEINKPPFVYPEKVAKDRYYGLLSTIVSVPSLMLDGGYEALVVFEGDWLLITKINRAGLYEPPDYDPDNYLVEGINGEEIPYRYSSKRYTIPAFAVTMPIDRRPKHELLGGKQ